MSALHVDQDSRRSAIAVVGMLVTVMAILAGARSVHYLLFHTMAEIFAIVVSVSIFTLTWTSHRYLTNGYLILLGGAYGAIGLVDVFHALTFRGMNLFPGVSTNYPTQFWLIARYLEALALLCGPFVIARRPNFYYVGAGFAAIAAAACVAVMYQWFPATFIDGAGLTPFKIVSEYVIIAMLLAGFVLLYRFRREFEPRIFLLLAISLWLAVATEICFTQYAGFYDFINELGHYFRFLSVALAFIAIVFSGVRQPLDLIFREIDEDARKMDELNKKLMESESRLSAVFQASPIGIVVSRVEDGKVLEVNDATLRLYGYTRDEAIGRTVAELGTYANPEERKELLQQLSAHGRVDCFPIDFRTHSGEVGTLELSGRVIELQGEKCLLSMIADVTERKRAEEKIHDQAFHDSLTHLPNRRLLKDRLRQTMAASKRSGCCGALLFLDLDNFKPLNDTHGHEVGDLLLIEAANRLKNCVREMDTVARFGGDEFVVMLRELDADRALSTSQAEVVAEKIRSALSKPYLLTIQHEGIADTTVEHRCTASIGIALFVNVEASDDDILRRADLAMYQAKRAGRNLIRFYDANVQVTA